MALDYRHLMQENIDGALDTDRAEELLKFLAKDEEAAEENARLEQVHRTLQKTQSVRAPERLAATIMARLAKTIEAQANLEPMPDEIKLALLMSLSIVQLSMMPTMLAASSLVLSGARSPEVLSRVMQNTIALMVMMIRALIVLMDEIDEMIEKDPDLAPVAMAMIPIALIGMLEYIQEDMNEQNGHLGK